MRHPCIVVRLTGAVYQWIEAPEDLPLSELRRQASAYAVRAGLRCCLVLGKSRCLYLEPDGSVTASDQPPRGGFCFHHPAEKWAEQIVR